MRTLAEYLLWGLGGTLPGDRNTAMAFGEAAWIANTTRAVEDKTTGPFSYESRLAKVDLPQEGKPRQGEAFGEATEGEEVERKERLKTKWAQLEAVVGGGEATSADRARYREPLRAAAGGARWKGDGRLQEADDFTVVHGRIPLHKRLSCSLRHRYA